MNKMLGLNLGGISSQIGARPAKGQSFDGLKSTECGPSDWTGISIPSATNVLVLGVDEG